MITHRTYQKESDVALLQTFTAQQSAQTDGCGYLHTGDICYHIFSGNKEFDPADILTIWEDEEGVAAWMLAAPRRKEFDAQIRMDLRNSGLEEDVLSFAEERTLEMMQIHGIDSDRLFADAHHCDTMRKQVLLDLGWQMEIESEYVLNKIALTNLAKPVLLDAYNIRPVHGIEEAAQLVEVHNASFGSSWTLAQYQRMMQSPDYRHELEFVVEATDGSFAGFTLTWHDTINKTGLLEPVGVHKNHRRKGLGKALVIYALHHMLENGMMHATVMNESANQAALNLYRSCGFRPWHNHDSYVKLISTA